MILVSVNQTWPAVLAGKMTAAQSTLGEWGQIGPKHSQEHIGDVLFGIYDNTIVSAFVIDDYVMLPDPSGEKRKARVQFAGHEEPAWSQYVGTPNPGRHWGDRGYARSVQIIPTELLTGDSQLAEVDDDGNRRAVIDGYIVTVTDEGAYIAPPPGGRVVVLVPRASASEEVGGGMR